MKDFGLIIFLSITGFLCAYGQQEKLDSLLLELQQYEKKDSTRIDLLNEISYQYYLLDPSAGVKFADSAISLSKDLRDYERLGKALSFKGHNLHAKGEDSAALALYEKSIKIYKQINDKDGLAKTRFSEGLVYFGRAEYDKSTRKHLEALEYFTRAQDTFRMGKTWNSIGINYMYQNNYPRSLKSFLKASKFYEASGPSALLDQAGIFANLGILYKQLKAYDTALSYQEKAYSIYQKKDYKLGMANSLISMGNILDSEKKTEAAIQLYRKAHSIGESISNKRVIAASLTNMGIAHSSAERYDLATKYLNETRRLYEGLGDDYNLAITLNALGEIYLKAEDGSQKSDTVEELLEKALAHSEVAESPQNQSRALENLAEFYYDNGNYRKAYNARVKAVDLHDSIFSLEKKEEIVRLEVQHEYQKKEAALKAENEKAQALAALEIEKRKLIKKFSIWSGSSLIVLVCAGLFFYKKHRDVKQITYESNFRAKIAETELKALRSQMNPHFIFNSLNSIKDFISRHETKTAENYLAKFASLMRRTLESSEKELVSLEEDLEIMELYMQLEAIRLNNKFTYSIQLAEDIDPQNTLVPPLLLQPFIENSIWHGLAPKESKGNISILIGKNSSGILCSIEDDGVGIKRSSTPKTAGRASLGIKISRTRLDILNRIKNTRAGIQIFSKEPGVKVEVQLPLKTAF